MFKFVKTRDFQTSSLFAFIGLVAGAFVSWYQILSFSDEMKQQVITQLGSVELLVPIASIQGAILTFIACFIGLKLSKRVNIEMNFKRENQSIIISVIIAFVLAFIITGADRFVFAKYLPAQITEYTFSPLYLISGILYGGIIEEILLRLFVMSLIVFILWKLFSKSKDSMHIPRWIYIAAILLAAVLFAAGHLPTTFQTLGNSPVIILRCMVLNGVGGIGFGYLFWKKGLSYSILAHASTHVFMQVVFMPILFN